MKKLLAWLLIVALLTGCAAFAEENGEYHLYRDIPEMARIAPAAAFAGGSGTAEDPWQIADGAQLALLREKIEIENETYERVYSKGHYVLTADIALNDVTGAADWAWKAPAYAWDPIGNSGIHFEGVFDGCGHTVSGMYINVNNEDGGDCTYGLFGRVSGVVKNLTVTDSYIAVSGVGGDVGGIAGSLNNSGALLENCASSVAIESYDGEIGGVVGSVSSGSTVKNCVFSGEIRQVKEGSVSSLGGVAGASNGNVLDCTGSGVLRFGATDASHAGGVVGRCGGGTISGCVHSGAMDCPGSGYVMADLGGVVGCAFLSGIGGQYASKGLTIENCVNRSNIDYAGAVGGIAGDVMNSGSHYALTISGCRNEGSVRSSDYGAGIVGVLTLEGNGVTLENCVNGGGISAAIAAGGIVAQFKAIEGNMRVTGCENAAPVATEGQNAAGVVAYWVAMFDGDVAATVEYCVNSGAITSMKHAGGILGNTDNTTGRSENGIAKLDVIGCRNSGAITGRQNNSFVGGIAANIGLLNVPTRIADCVNTGSVALDYVIDEKMVAETQASPAYFTLSQIAGGIVGRIGEGLMLTTDQDDKKAENVGAAEALAVIENCVSTGAISVPDYSAYLHEDGGSIWQNCVGGIVGQASGDDGLSVNIIDCRYAGAERGLGSAEYADFGERMTGEEAASVAKGVE